MAIAKPGSGEGGYEYQFVNAFSDMYVCKICQYPSREPYLSACCGHTFCKSCLEAVKRTTTTTNACPICREEKSTTIPNKQVDRAIRSLHVFCTNKDKGCEWQGEVNDIINHLGNSDGCRFEEVACSNDCGKCLQQQYLTSHVEDECVRRKVHCQYCHITGEHQFIEGEHKEQCPKFPMACPNKCEADNIPRENIDEHRKMCPLEEVTCPNDCGMTLQQQYLTSHLKMECPRLKVDCQYCHITGERQFIEGEHKEQCPKFPIACPNNCEVGSVPRDDVKEHMKMCPLELIQCEYHMVGCEERMARKDQKKHNKEKMEDHLLLSTSRLTNTQNIVQSLYTNYQNLTSAQLNAVQTIDQLIQRLQQTERDTASQLKAYKDEFDMITEQRQKETKEQLAVTKEELTFKLQQAENELTATKQELAAAKDTLATAQEEAKKTKDGLTKQFKQLESTYKDEINVMHNEMDALRKKQEETKEKEDKLTKELDQAKQSVNSMTKEVDLSKQNLDATKDDFAQRIATSEQEAKKKINQFCQHFEQELEVIKKLPTKLESEIQAKTNELERKLQNSELFKSAISTWEVFIYTRALNLANNYNFPVIIVMGEPKISELTSKIIKDWFSESFYTNPRGYKMCLKVQGKASTASDNPNKPDLSVSLYLMKGPYDDRLRWPLKGHCEVKLLNQIQDSDHQVGHGVYTESGYDRIYTSRERGWMWTEEKSASDERGVQPIWCSGKFISYENLHKVTPICQYFKGGRIFLQVVFTLD